MGCINKLDKKFISLEKRYGDFISEIIIRGHEENRYLNPESDEFYIPSVREAISILKSQVPNAARRKVIDGLSVNEYLPAETLASYLIGFIHRDAKYDNDYVITIGDKNGNVFAKKDVYDENVNLLEGLQERFPDIFKLEKTYDDNTFKVFINPRVESAQKEIFDEVSPSMQTAIDRFNYLTRLKGFQPAVFEIGNQRWIQTSTNLYSLVNRDTGTYVYNNINLQDGTAQEQRTPLDIDNNDVAIREVEALASQEGFAMVFSLHGYNLDIVLANMKEAQTQEEFDMEYAKVKKFYCR